jgi:hypothetical protein
MNRIDPGVFTARGVVAIGYAGFAFALGVAAGALLRRTLPAMAATLLGFVAARFAFTLWARPHLLAPRESVVPVTMGKGVPFFTDGSGWSVAAAPPPIPNAWTTSATFVDRGRHVVSGAQLHALISDVCPAVAAGGGKGAPPPGCEIALSRHVQQLVTYQPASHFWALQGLETAIFLGSALALTAATVWLVGRRTGPKPALSGSAGRATDPVALTLTPGN